MTQLAIVAVLMACLSAVPGYAQDIALGGGYADYPDSGIDTPIVSLDYRHRPFFERGTFSAAFSANLSATGEGDGYLGAGVGLRWDWHSGWFAEASLMPGMHVEGFPGNDLGSDFDFRSLLAIGYRFGDGNRLSLAITHKSNAGIDIVNPGVDAVLLRYHWSL